MKQSLSLKLGQGEISGVARNEKGEPVPGAGVALIPNPRRPFRLKLTRTDQNGGFKIANAAPGEYLLVSLDAVDGAALENEDYIKPWLSKMKSVKIQGAGSQNFELTVLKAAQE